MVPGAHDFSPVRFSTNEVPEKDRLPRWREEFGRSVLHVDIEPLPGRPFQVEATLRAVPGLRTVVFTGSRMRFDRTCAMAASGDGSIGLVVNFDGQATVSQRDHDMQLGLGEAFPILTDEPATLTGHHHIGLLFPRSVLSSRIKNLEDAVKLPISSTTEALRLLISYVGILSEAHTLASQRLRRTILNHIYDLAALAIKPQDALNEDSLGTVAAARLKSTLDFIGKHFNKPELTIAAVARSQGVSPRYLQRLIGTTGTSFTEHVGDLRLQLAYELLTAGNGNARISDISLEAGFSDISQFNRLFRRRFGDTPKGVRGTARSSTTSSEA